MISASDHLKTKVNRRSLSHSSEKCTLDGAHAALQTPARGVPRPDDLSVKPDIYSSLIVKYCSCFGATGMWGFISLHLSDTSNSYYINWFGFHRECVERNKNTRCRTESLESLKIIIVRPNKHCIVDF